MEPYVAIKGPGTTHHEHSQNEPQQKGILNPNSRGSLERRQRQLPLEVLGRLLWQSRLAWVLPKASTVTFNT